MQLNIHPFTRCACLHLEAQARSDLPTTSDPSGVNESPVGWTMTEADLLHRATVEQCRASAVGSAERLVEAVDESSRGRPPGGHEELERLQQARAALRVCEQLPVPGQVALRDFDE